jgi:dihydropteroate synthase
MNVKNTLLPVQTLLQSRGKLLDISQPAVMGILNATPDSFYNQGRESGLDDLLRNAEKMIAEGATILDIGGATTKPGAALIDTQTEQDRIIPVIEAIHRHFPETWLSIDTYNAATAKAAVDAGVAIINDISAGTFDDAMLPTVASLQVPYIAMHIQGKPETMQLNPQYENVVSEVRNALRTVCEKCDASGINDLILDVGFGFGKTVAHNFQLLNHLHSMRILGKPILAGISRKSMICKTLNLTPDEALNGTTALHMIALQQGANILRVHDVKEAMEVIKLWKALASAN